MAKKTGTLALLTLALTACATAKSGFLGGASSEPKPLVWPQPPAAARIAFSGVLGGEQDLGHDAPLSDTLSRFLTGQTPHQRTLVQPMDIAVSDDGRRLVVSDFGNDAVFVFDLKARTMEPLGGRAKSWARPFGLAIDFDGRVYVVEQAAKAITAVDSSGKILFYFGHRSLQRPTDIEIDRKRGLLYVVDGSTQDSAGHTIKVFDRRGKFLREIGQGKGVGAGHLMFPTYAAVDAAGDLYVSDTVNSRIVVFDHEGRFRRQIGRRGVGFGTFDKPKGLAVDSRGELYVVDSGWSNVQVFTPSGKPSMFFSARGTGPGMMRNPTGLAVDREGTVYVADYLNRRIDVFRRVTSESSIKRRDR